MSLNSLCDQIKSIRRPANIRHVPVRTSEYSAAPILGLLPSQHLVFQIIMEHQHKVENSPEKYENIFFLSLGNLPT